jgi:hypothetical protein
MTHFDKATADAIENLKNFDNALNKYAKLSPGESKAWYFDPNSVEKVVNQYNQERIRFKVFDPEINKESIWDASPGAARQVIAALRKQIFFLKVQRQGEGKETRYQVSAVGEQLEDSGGELE